MTDRRIEVLPDGASATSTHTPVRWPVARTATAEMKCDLPWMLDPFDAADPTAKDLARIAVAAFLADVSAAKPAATLYRALDLVVHVENQPAWTTTAIRAVVDLLHWLTGDTWTLTTVSATPSRSQTQTEMLAVDGVQLLSGGLDSLCGAALTVNRRTPTLFLGHTDTATSVAHAQASIDRALAGRHMYRRFHIHPGPALPRRNRGPRSRSFMFIALAVAAASAARATRVVVPENGFTSINPPLDPSRGGILTTRSTHPWTFHSVRQLLALLGLSRIEVANPYLSLTKGELVDLAAAMLVAPAWTAAVADSLSCAKLDARLSGVSPNLNCGLCVACVVRRAAFKAAGVKDPSSYAVQVASGGGLSRLVQARREDLAAIRYATKHGFEEDHILAAGMWPTGTDFDKIVDICERGRQELKLVRLPQ